MNYSLPMFGYQNISHKNVTIGIPGVDGNKSVTRDILSGKTTGLKVLLSWVKGPVCLVFKFAFPPFSPPLPSPQMQISKQNTH